MSPISFSWRLASVLPSGALAWPHLQRLAERWLRRWGFALAGLVLGLSLMWLARPEVSELYAAKAQAVAQLQQQLAGMPAGASVQTPADFPAKSANSAKSATEAQRLLSGLPNWAQPDDLWVDWQHAMAAHGLRLQFLQPMPPSAAQVRSGALVSHAAAWRVVGRFEDWVRVWAACAESGPICTLDRISVVATDHPAEVQIDAVMRLWMRPADGLSADGADARTAQSLADPAQDKWMAAMLSGSEPDRRAGVTLFSPRHGATEAAAAAAVVATIENTGDGGNPAKSAEGTSAAVASSVVLPEDPGQWPLSQVRLAGLWRQGDDRQAVLSAGTHWAKVAIGQRVSLEGHRVVTITDEGVRLRLGNGPVLKLAWPQAHQGAGAQVLPLGRSAASSASPNPVSPSQHSTTTGSQPR